MASKNKTYSAKLVNIVIDGYGRFSTRKACIENVTDTTTNALIANRMSIRCSPTLERNLRCKNGCTFEFTAAYEPANNDAVFECGIIPPENIATYNRLTRIRFIKLLP